MSSPGLNETAISAPKANEASGVNCLSASLYSLTIPPLPTAISRPETCQFQRRDRTGTLLACVSSVPGTSNKETPVQGSQPLTHEPTERPSPARSSGNRATPGSKARGLLPGHDVKNLSPPFPSNIDIPTRIRFGAGAVEELPHLCNVPNCRLGAPE